MSRFPRPSPLDWRNAAIETLKDRPLESLIHLDADQLATRPIYAKVNASDPVFAPRAGDCRGRAWDIRAVVESDQSEQLAQAVRAALSAGATSLLLAGPLVTDGEALSAALEVETVTAGIALDAGFEGLAAAKVLAEVAGKAAHGPLSFHLDPVSAYARCGGAPEDISDLMTRWAQDVVSLAVDHPLASLYLASGQVVHEAGGSAGQELAFTLAAAVAYVRHLIAAGLDPRAALEATTLGVVVDQQMFDSLSKIRALRLLWDNVARAFGVEVPARIEARSSQRMLTALDPWPNVPRLDIAAFAAAVGGADVVVLDGFTRAGGLPDNEALAQAVESQLVLMDDAHLGMVDDPASGSWYLDARTRELAQAAWSEFQTIEAEGGIVEALSGHLVQPRIQRSRQHLARLLLNGIMPIVGVTQDVDNARRATRTTPATMESVQYGLFEPLRPIRLSSSFEKGMR